MVSSFKQWLEEDEAGMSGSAFAGLPYGSVTVPNTQTTPPNQATQQPGLTGVPADIVQWLQSTGPQMQNILNAAQKSMQMGQSTSLADALNKARQQHIQQNANQVQNAVQPIG